MGSSTHHPTKFRLTGRDNPRTVRDAAMQCVSKDLRHRTISFELEPGASLSMQELADEFGTSQTPIGEALLKLAGEYPVNVAPQSGTSILLIDA